MIFRTAVRLTSHKLGSEGLYPKEMFENDVNEKNSVDGAIRDSYCVSQSFSACDVPSNESNPQFTLKSN